MPTTTLNRSFKYVLPLSGVLLGLSAGFLSFWTDSEMWPVAATKYLFSERAEYYFGTKPLFHLLLYLNQGLDFGLGIHPMDTARAFMVFNFLGIITAFYLIVRQLSKERTYALLAVAFLLSISFMVKRGGDVRSDMIVTHIFLWLLYRETLEAQKHKLGIFLLGSFLAILASPKAILWIIAFLPFQKSYLLKYKQKAKTPFFILLGLLATVILVPPLRHYVLELGTFFSNSLHESEVGVDYFSWARLQYLRRFCFENPHFIITYLAVAGLSWRFPTKTHLEMSIQWMGFLFLGCLLIYPDRLPFLIAAIVPFFVVQIFSSPAIRAFFAERTPAQVHLRMLTVGICFLLTLHWARVVLGTHSNSGQREIATWFRTEVDKLPSIEIYDPVGIIPQYEANYWFLGPGQVAKNQYVINYINELLPEVILYVQKSAFLEPRLAPILLRDYIGDGAGIFVRRLHVPEIRRNALKTAELKTKLKAHFPRLAGQKDVVWRVTFDGALGSDLNQPLTWEYLENNDRLVFPKGITSAYFQPFELKLPFGTNLGNEFRFDWEF